MSTFILTHALAVAEQARRIDNRKRKAQGLAPKPAPHPELLRLTGADLADAIDRAVTALEHLWRRSQHRQRRGLPLA